MKVSTVAFSLDNITSLVAVARDHDGKILQHSIAFTTELDTHLVNASSLLIGFQLASK